MSPGPLLKDNFKLRLLRFCSRLEWIRHGVFRSRTPILESNRAACATFDLDFRDLRYH